MSSNEKIDFACPGCGHIFEQKKASYAGKICECRYCKVKFLVKPISTLENISEPILSTNQAVILAVIITFALSSVAGFFLGGFLNKDAAQKYREQKTVAVRQAGQLNEQQQQTADAKQQVADAKQQVARLNAEKQKLAESLVLAEYGACLNAHTKSLSRILSVVDNDLQIITFASVYSEIYKEIYEEIISLSIVSQVSQHRSLVNLSRQHKEALAEIVITALSQSNDRVGSALNSNERPQKTIDTTLIGN